jgi:PiT family inorganic phosphate transporter
MTSGLKSVRWLVAARILWAWILTIPVAGLIAALFYLVYSAIF